MANDEHIRILKCGAKIWNDWREKHPQSIPDLSGEHIQDFDLRRANLRHANLTGMIVIGSDLSEAILIQADLSLSYFNNVNFTRADLTASDLTFADIIFSDFSEANLSGATITNARFKDVLMDNANLRQVHMVGATFSNIDLSLVKGLSEIQHFSPSTIGVDTLYKSGGNIPKEFLQGCGTPHELITFLPSLIGAQQAIQFYSCFISYNTRDEEFARRLYSRMQDDKLRVWFAPEDMKGGQKLHEQIEDAIQLHDKLLIVLSDNSLQSEWVMTEIRNARRVEIEEKRRKLFPIRLVDIDVLRRWKCFDADSGKDLAVEVREYFIPDFSSWKDHDAFELAFERLLRDLKAG